MHSLKNVILRPVASPRAKPSWHCMFCWGNNIQSGWSSCIPCDSQLVVHQPSVADIKGAVCQLLKEGNNHAVCAH